MVPNYPYFGFPNYMKYMNSLNNRAYASSVNPYCNVPANRLAYSHSQKANQNSSETGNINRTLNINKNLRSNIANSSNMNTNIGQIQNLSSLKYVNQNAFLNMRKNPKNVSDTEHFSDDYQSPIFTILGLNIFFDDVLIICLLFFLYHEKVEDYSIYLALILLLLS